MNTAQRAKKAAFLTLGCKVNQYETHAMEELLSEAGYQLVDPEGPADVYIVNTCSVTNMADRKSRQMIRRARKRNPGAVVAACGCYVQAFKEKAAQEGLADIIIGNNKKKDIVRILDQYFSTRERIAEVADLSHCQDYEDLSIHRTDGHTRAYVKIQDGCNQFCSYCIIPYTRGRIRSRKAEEVLLEIRDLAGAGYREIVLTGIHLSSYGKDLEEGDLISLLEKLNAIPGIDRIRLGSLEPRIITRDFVQRLVRLEKVCPHFHLSLQSGCDATLKRMNRHYTTEDYLRSVDLLRQYYEAPALTTDIIAGFPGETEEEFAQTISYLQQIRLYEMHIFRFSSRKGTRAETMPDQLTQACKVQRSSQLLALTKELKKEYEASFIGTWQSILLEEESWIGGQRYMLGYTDRYLRIAVKFDEKDTIIRQNAIVVVKIQGFLDESLLFGKVSIEF